LKLRKFRWSKVYESSEEELREFLLARQIESQHWTAEAFQEFGERQLEQAMTLWCAEGSLTARVDGTTVSLQPGDAVAIPPAVSYSLKAGMAGCICYETKPLSHR